MNKSLFKKISLGVLGIGILGGCITLFSHFMNNSDKTLHLDYDIGALTDQGKYLEDEGKLYTKNAFECKGNKFKLAFDSQINYQAYYYDDLDNLVGKTKILSTSEAPAVPYNADYARLVITPTNDDDGKISFTEKYKYASQIDVSVSKVQTSKIIGTTYLYDRRIYVIDDTSILNFKYGGTDYSSGKFDEVYTDKKTFISFDNQILKINKGMKLTVNSNFSDKEDWYINLYEISELPPTLDTFVGGKYTKIEKGNSYTFDSNTNYIFLEISAGGNGSVNIDSRPTWSDSEFNKIINSFTISKA